MYDSMYETKKKTFMTALELFETGNTPSRDN